MEPITAILLGMWFHSAAMWHSDVVPSIPCALFTLATIATSIIVV